MPEPEPDTTEDIYNLFCGNGRKGYVWAWGRLEKVARYRHQ
jgi:hypothetical protein